MEASKLSQKFRETKWMKFAAIISVILLVVLVFFLVRSWFAPRVPQISNKWYQETVGYWAFEEQGGQQIKDAGPRALHGQLGNSSRIDRCDPKRAGGKLGSGLKLEGEDYALVPYDSSFDLEKEVSLEAWVKPQASSANEDLWLSGWKYRRRIILNNEERNPFEEAQVNITLNTKRLIKSNKLQSDCEDLRFTESNKTTKLDWFLEEGCNSTSTEIWVKVPYLKAKSETPIYFYYGNFDAPLGSSFTEAMEVPPLKSWQWPRTRHWVAEKAFNATVNSKDEIIVGGFQNDRAGGGQEWKVVDIRSDGRVKRYRTYEYSSGANRINDIAVNSRDNTILAGFDTGKGDSQWRVKRKEAGRGSWEYTVNPSSDSDRATAVAIDSSDNVIVGGFDNSKGVAQWRVEKLDSNGEKLWPYTKNHSSGSDLVKDVAIDSEGNILVAGVDKKKGNDQWRLEKLSPDGDFLYAYKLNPSNDSDVLTNVAVDPQDNIILAGTDFREGNFGWRVVKLDSEAERIWAYKKNYSPGSDEINTMEVDKYGNIIIGGYDYTKGEAQWRVEKLNPEGEKLWAYTENPTSGLDPVNGITIDSKGNIILAGFAAKEKSEFLVEKISERKYYDLEPGIDILEETTFQEIPELVIGKLGSYGLIVNRGQVTGSINGNLISTSLTEGWNHLMLTYDGSQEKIYVNSELKASQALTGNINTNYNNLLLGFNYAGLLDEVKIYNEALTSEDIQEIYQSFK